VCLADVVFSKREGLEVQCSKLGDGYSSSRQVGEIVYNVYACLPGYLGGLEATIHVRSSVPKDTGLVAAESIVHDAVGMIVEAISDGRIV
jgi:hypothetical protein